MSKSAYQDERGFRGNTAVSKNPRKRAARHWFVFCNIRSSSSMSLNICFLKPRSSSWLVRDHGGKLPVVSSANQDNPMSQGFYPIMGNDRLGTRLLPEIPEPQRRLPEGMVERVQLGRSQQALSGQREVERKSYKTQLEPL